MLLIFLGAIAVLTLSVIVVRTFVLDENERITEIYTCHCGSDTHLWLSSKKLECKKCGMVKEVNHNGIILR